MTINRGQAWNSDVTEVVLPEEQARALSVLYSQDQGRTRLIEMVSQWLPSWVPAKIHTVAGKLGHEPTDVPEAGLAFASASRAAECCWLRLDREASPDAA